MSLALQVLVTGLAAGGVYGLVAIGHSLVYRLTGIVHFAFGDLVGLGVFTTLLVAAGTAPVGQEGMDRGRFLLALAVGLAVCTVAGALSYTLAGHTTPRIGGRDRVVWAVDTVVEVDDQELGIAGTFWIEAVEFSRGPETNTTITLMRPGDLVFGGESE